jgi:hypothetical protein
VGGASPFIAGLALVLVPATSACDTHLARDEPRARDPAGDSRVFANPPGAGRPPRSLRIDVSDADAPAAFTRGWGGAEGTARWSVGPSSRLDFDFLPDAHPYVLEIDARAVEGASPMVVRVVVNGHAAGTLAPGAAQGITSLGIARELLRRGHNAIELSYAWTRRASDTDSRDIAVSFRSLALVPAGDRASLDLSEPSARASLGSEWALAAGEGSDEHEGSSAAIAGACANVDLFLDPPRAPCFLSIAAASADRADAGADMRVSLNGAALGSAHVVPSFRDEVFEVAGSGVLRSGANRLELCAAGARVRAIALEPAASEIEWDVGSEEARAALAGGWSREERDRERAFAWSDAKRSVLELRMLPAAGAYELRLEGRGVAPSLAVDVTVNGRGVGRYSPGAGWTGLRVLLAPGVLARGRNEIELGYSETLTPSLVLAGSTDARELGFALTKLRLAPLPGPS